MNDDPLKEFGNGVRKAMESIRPNLEALRRPINIPSIEPPRIPDSHLNPARWTYKRLAEYIKDFEEELDEEHEIGARLVSFGSNIIFHIEDMGYYGPDIIAFYGLNDKGEKVQLIQNIAQLSVLLVAVKKLGEKARRIGFILVERTESDDHASEESDNSNDPDREPEQTDEP